MEVTLYERFRNLLEFYNAMTNGGAITDLTKCLLLCHVTSRTSVPSNIQGLGGFLSSTSYSSETVDSNGYIDDVFISNSDVSMYVGAYVS